MPAELVTKTIRVDNLLKALDIDEGIEGKKEVPVNMIFSGVNELEKDTGIENFSNVGTGIIKSLHSFVRRDGTKYFIRNLGTVLQRYNPATGNFEDFKTGLSDGKRFGYKEYDDWLYMGNGYDNYMRWNGTTLTEYPALPKGNILEVFEDRMFVAGNPANPLSIWYSAIGDPTSFPTANVIKPVGTDKITGLARYYDALIVLKERSVWKITFHWDGTNWIPRIENLSANIGCISPKAYCWVENDIWFFTGTEVRRIGWLLGRGEIAGVMGFDPTSLSEQIKEALKKVRQDYASESAAFYHDKRFYLAVPIFHNFNDIIYVCHLLYQKSWTKLAKRKKACANCFVVFDKEVYSASSNVEGRIYKWTSGHNDAGDVIPCYVVFKEIGSPDFNLTQIYRYLDVEFKNIEGSCKIELIFNEFDERRKKIKEFYLGTLLETEEDAAGEILIGDYLIGDAFGEEVEPVEYLKRRFSLLEKGNTIKIKFLNNRLNENFVLSKFSLEFKERSRRYISPESLIYAA